MNRILLILILIGLITGCDLYKQDDYTEDYVVEAYLVANRTFPEVLLTRTAPAQQKYNFKDRVIKNAAVKINRLRADSSVASSHSYQYSEGNYSYIPTASDTVRDETLYRLDVDLPNGDHIDATTYVPGDFKTTNKDQLQNSYIYQGKKQIKINTTPSSYITNRQTFYIFTVNVVDTTKKDLTPFYADVVDDEDIPNYYINSSGIINEKNYDRNDDNTITLTLPWIAIAFYGKNDVVANAIDDNMYDFLRSQDVQTGGMSLSPGAIQNIRYHVNGGIGIFGSLSSDTNRVVINKKPK